MKNILSILFLFSSQASAVCIKSTSGGSVCIGGSNTPAAVSSLCNATDPLAPACLPTLSYSGPSYIYTTTISTKVLRDVGGVPAGAMHVSTPAGLRGETVWSQVHINAPAGGLTAVNVWMTNLTNSQTGAVISSETATLANSAQIFVSSYVYIATASAQASKSYMGAYHFVPDIAIPINDAYFHQHTNALPLNITAGENQSFIIEVRIPTGIASGYWTYSFNVSTGGNLIATIPGALMVYDGTIPFNSNFPSYIGFGYALMCQAAYGGVTNAGCDIYNHTVCGGNDDKCAQVTLHDECLAFNDRRISCGQVNNGGWSDAQTMQLMGDLLQGTTVLNMANSIFGTPKITGVTLRGIGTAPATVLNSMTNFSNNGVLSSTSGVYYVVDEPNAGQWTTAKASMTSIHTYGGTNLITTDYATMVAQSADSLVDILLETVNQKYSDSASAKAWAVASSSRSNGWYYDCLSGATDPTDGKGACNAPAGPNNIGGGTGWPSPHIDAFATANESIGFVMLHDSATFSIMSRADQCYQSNSLCGNLVAGSTNPWGASLSGGGGAGSAYYKGQGDEQIAYFGTANILGAAVVKPILVASNRILSIQQGQQDMERAKIISDAGQGNYVVQQKATFLSDEKTFNRDPYNTNGSWTGTITSARQNMGCKIHQLAKPGSSCAY